MIQRFIKTAVRLRFAMTSRKAAARQARRWLAAYSSLADGLSQDAGKQPVEVPPMIGIDEDMRRWSFFMILQHNAIVNRAVSAAILRLARGEPLDPAAAFDAKKDVMPSPSCR